MWNKLFGKRRYLWLIQRKKRALIRNENIDDIYIQVFSSINLSKNHTKEDYHYLIQSLDLLHNNNKIDPSIFSLELICSIVIKMNAESPPLAWEIIYRMIRLYKVSPGCDALLLYHVLQKLEDQMDGRGNRIHGIISTISILLSSHEKSFEYICFLLDILRKRLDEIPIFTTNNYLYPSTSFTEQILLNKQRAIKRLRDSEHFGIEHRYFSSLRVVPHI